MIRPTAGVAGLAGWLASVVLVAGALGVTIGGGRSLAWLVVTGLVLLPFATVGALLCSRVPQNPIGWLFLGCGAVVAAACLLQAYSTLALADGLPAGIEAAVAVHVIYGPLVAAVLAAMLLLFPDGHLPSWRWRPVAYAEAAVFAVFTVAQAMGHGALNQLDPSRAVSNPLGVSGRAGTAIDLIAALALVILFTLIAASAVSLVRRFRFAEGALRQQLKWFGGAATLLTAAYASGGILWNVSGRWALLTWIALFALATIALPIATGIAILRYRLYEIDVIIRRTLVYTTLLGSLALVYLSGIYLIDNALQTLTGQSGTLAVTLSTLAVAVAFQPLQRRIQRGVDRRFYRRKYDAVATLDAFTSHLRDRVDLDALEADVLDVVTVTVHPRHASLWLRAGVPPEPAGRNVLGTSRMPQ